MGKGGWCMELSASIQLTCHLIPKPNLWKKYLSWVLDTKSYDRSLLSWHINQVVKFYRMNHSLLPHKFLCIIMIFPGRMNCSLSMVLYYMCFYLYYYMDSTFFFYYCDLCICLSLLLGCKLLKSRYHIYRLELNIQIFRNRAYIVMIFSYHISMKHLKLNIKVQNNKVQNSR